MINKESRLDADVRTALVCAYIIFIARRLRFNRRSENVKQKHSSDDQQHRDKRPASHIFNRWSLDWRYIVMGNDDIGFYFVNK